MPNRRCTRQRKWNKMKPIKATTATLSDAIIRDIRRLCKRLSQTEVARKFGLGQTVVNKIVNRKTYGWVK